MLTAKQKIWDTISESYRDGPSLAADKKTFVNYCMKDSFLRVRKSTASPNTSSNAMSRDRGSWATGRLALTGNQFVGFKPGETSSKLWLTTYPFVDRNDKRLTGDTILFHVHLTAEKAIAKPITVNWLSSLLYELDANPPEATSWRTPMRSLQIAPAPSPNRDFSDDNMRPDFIANDGPILRSSVDVLYLDKSFWRQYFERYNQSVDIFIPGVNSMDLAQIQKVAVDIAVLRNREEFSAVARTIARHLPSVNEFSAIVTNVIPRVADVPEEQIALLEDGLPDVLVSLEEKVRLGVHENANLIPAHGIVSANLSRLNLVATPTRAFQTRHMLLAYFNDAVKGVHSESAEVDLPRTD